MIKNFICLRDCEFKYQPKAYAASPTFKYKFQAGMAYMINATYILDDKDKLHQIHRDSKTLIYGYASTKFIYRNFVLEDDYFSVNAMFTMLFSMDTILTMEQAKTMRKSLFQMKN